MPPASVLNIIRYKGGSKLSSIIGHVSINLVLWSNGIIVTIVKISVQSQDFVDSELTHDLEDAKSSPKIFFPDL